MKPHGKSGDLADARRMVTAEIAVGVLTVLLVASLLSVVVASLSLRSQCQAAASEIARHTARADAAAVAAAEAELPAHFSVEQSTDGSMITVTVRAPVRVGAFTWYEVSSTVHTRSEPGP